MKVYLDDIRKCPEGWVLARNVTEAKILLETGDVTHLSLDFDLGYGEPTGLDLCRWMKQTGNWPRDVVEIHSSHPLGRVKMRAFIQENRPISNTQDSEPS